jgi:hypothetical protein
MAEVDERGILAWLCAQLPTLRAAAVRDGWRTGLERQVDAIRGGGSPRRACQRLGLETDPEQYKAGFASVGGFGLDAPVVAGDYRCPRDRCDRRAQPDERGRVPVCALEAMPMPLRARPIT